MTNQAIPAEAVEAAYHPPMAAARSKSLVSAGTNQPAPNFTTTSTATVTESMPPTKPRPCLLRGLGWWPTPEQKHSKTQRRMTRAAVGRATSEPL